VPGAEAVATFFSEKAENGVYILGARNAFLSVVQVTPDLRGSKQ